MLGYNTLSADWKGYQVLAVYANFTRASHDVTVKHIQAH